MDSVDHRAYNYMTYDDLVKFIKNDGCRVNVYKSKASIHGGSRGTFDHNEAHGPIICVATKNVDKKRKLETLLHEYGHYLQYKDGFMQYLDGIADCNQTTTSWLAHKIELTNREVSMIRNMMLTMEYDAEKRAHQVGCSMAIDGWDEEFYLQGAQAYMDLIKWQFKFREDLDKAPTRKIYKPKILTLKELLAPLSDEKIKKILEKSNLSLSLAHQIGTSPH